MPSAPLLALLAASAPLLVGALLSRLLRAPAGVARRLTVWSATATLALTVAATVAFALTPEPRATSVLAVVDPAGLHATLSVYVDALTLVVLGMISIVAVAVSLYSVRYLDGEPGQARFSQWLSFTVGAVCTIVVSGNLVMFWVAWVACSLGLHQLLTHFEERPGARLAAKKKFVISRLGDAFLLFGFLLLYLLFGSVEYATIFDAARAGEGTQPWLTLAAVFLALGAMAKSAQLPLHTWLPDTMETPTPVSALMHAGIINAGGFLLLRLSPVLVAAPLALELLVVVGATTAAFASVVMLTQTDIKRKLAYSTVSQMGFMMLQIGLGAFTLAALHIVGHSFYKAHAFLSAASSVRAAGSPARDARPPWVGALAALAASAGLVFGLAWLLLGPALAHEPGAPVLLGVLTLAVAQLVLASGGVGGGRVRAYGAGLLAGAAVTAAYFGLGAGAQVLLGEVVAPAAGGWTGLTIFALGLFVGTFLLQLGPRALFGSELGRRLYTLAYNGFYLGALQDRFVERLWPDVRGGH